MRKKARREGGPNPTLKESNDNCLRSHRDSVYITPIEDTTPFGSYAKYA
jgi:hypothetical protein